MRTKDQKNVVSIPDKAGWCFHWICSVFSFTQGSNEVLGLDPELPKALESLAGMRVVNSGSVTGRRIDGEKDVTSGSSRHFQFLLQM